LNLWQQLKHAVDSGLEEIAPDIGQDCLGTARKNQRDSMGSFSKYNWSALINRHFMDGSREEGIKGNEEEWLKSIEVSPGSEGGADRDTLSVLSCYLPVEQGGVGYIEESRRRRRQGLPLVLQLLDALHFRNP